MYICNVIIEYLPLYSLIVNTPSNKHASAVSSLLREHVKCHQPILCPFVTSTAGWQSIFFHSLGEQAKNS